jgi:hypothetical protein
VSTFAELRRLALALPGVEEGTSYGTPAFRVKGKGFARLHEDGESVVLYTDFVTREALVTGWPKKYHYTAHYDDYPMVLVRIPAVARAELAERLLESWTIRAPKRLLEGAEPSAARPGRRAASKGVPKSKKK